MADNSEKISTSPENENSSEVDSEASVEIPAEAEIEPDTENKQEESCDESDNQPVSDEDHEKSEKKAVRKTRHTVFIVLFNIITSLVLSASILAASVVGFCVYLFGDMHYNAEFPAPENHEALGIDPVVVEKLPKGIYNIALFGIDSQNKATDNSVTISGRSDSIIILSIDTNKKVIKMTSILRDSWVPIERKNGKVNYKINTAYALGGATLAVKTLNQNFNLDITEYASVSMHQLATIIDDIGGVDITITEKERQAINKGGFIAGAHKDNEIEQSGLVHMTGVQAIAFARIRKIDTDMMRAGRHQKVLVAMLEKIRTLPLSSYPALLNKMLGRVETSMSYNEIFEFVPLVVDTGLKIETTTVPGKGIKYKSGIFSDTRGGWVWKYDLDKAAEYIHEWIYGVEPEQEEPTDSSQTTTSN